MHYGRGQAVLIDGDFGGNLSPETSIAHRHHRFLRVTVDVHMQHETAEGRSQVVGQTVVEHTAKDQVHRQLTGDLVYGQVLTVQTHSSKQV